MKKSNSAELTHLIVLIFAGLLLFQDLFVALSQQNQIIALFFKYLDELMPFVLFFLLLISKLIQGQSIYLFDIWLPLLLFCSIALISSLLAKVEAFIFSAQFVLYLKAFVFYFFLGNLPFKMGEVKKYINYFFILGLIFLFWGVLDFLFPLFIRQSFFNDNFVEYM